MEYFVSVKAKDEKEGLEKAKQIIKTKSTILDKSIELWSNGTKERILYENER